MYGKRGPSVSIRQWIVYTYRTRILSILKEEQQYFDNLATSDIERSLSWAGDGVTLHGRIDRIIEIDPEKKEWGVIDFKKGKTEANIMKDDRIASYQLLVYQALIERSALGKAVLAAYYSVKEGRYRFLYKTDELKDRSSSESR